MRVTSENVGGHSTPGERTRGPGERRVRPESLRRAGTGPLNNLVLLGRRHPHAESRPAQNRAEQCEERAAGQPAEEVEREIIDIERLMDEAKYRRRKEQLRTPDRSARLSAIRRASIGRGKNVEDEPSNSAALFPRSACTSPNVRQVRRTARHFVATSTGFAKYTSMRKYA